MRRKRPDLFEKAIGIEARLNDIRTHIGRDEVFLHSSCKPLAEAVPEQAGLFDVLDAENDRCDSGYCWT
jgi:hypothetical protein